MQEKIVLSMVVFFFGVIGLRGADFTTQLQSQNPLSRSPVIKWTTYSLRAQEDSMGLAESPLDRNFFKSALIPGWGQFSQGKTIRSGLFLGIEGAGIAGYLVYDKKYEEKKDEFQAHAEKYWNLEDWLNYYNPEDQPSTHSINIRYRETGEVYSYPTNEPTDYPCDPETCPDAWEMVWDHEGYENAYKYDQFASGWTTFDRNNPDNTETADHLNPKRAENKKLRDKANDFADTSMLFVSGIIFNHIASAFETVFFKPEGSDGAGMRLQMRYRPMQLENRTINTLNFEVRW
ncbi:MAG: hypothetical protein MAGBODY4_01569 [Candidatus Marinimicrobia bacterium]|nr:hypothetical protein [Candidatus Neomarinimicrobiota bacterium]